MSFPLNDNAAEAKWQELLASDSWNQEIVPTLPKNLEEQAFLLGAITRKSGKIHRAEVAQKMRQILEGMYKDLEEGEVRAEKDEEQIKHVLSEWRLQKTSMNLFRQQVQGPLRKQDLLERLPRLERHFRDTPRKRTHEWTRATQSLVDPQYDAIALETGKSRKGGSALTTGLA